MHGEQSDETYAADVTLVASLPVDESTRFEDLVRETFNATVTPETIDVVNRAVAQD